MKHMAFLLMICALMAVADRSSGADTVHTVLLTSGSVEAKLDAPEGSPYSILQVTVPTAVTAGVLVRAILEFRADVDARGIDGWVNDTPIVEVYALSGDMTGEFDAGKLLKPSSMNQPVLIGLNKSVRIDITEAVRLWIENPSKNHGLVMGSFRGDREGIVTLKADPAREGALAAVTFLCR